MDEWHLRRWESEPGSTRREGILGTKNDRCKVPEEHEHVTSKEAGVAQLERVKGGEQPRTLG